MSGITSNNRGDQMYWNYKCGNGRYIKKLTKETLRLRNEWIEKVKNDPELQKSYDKETGNHL